VDIAEAMAARGYGSAPPTRLRQPDWIAVERRTFMLALALATIAVAVIAGAGAYRIYPVAESITDGPALVAAIATTVIGLMLALILHRNAGGVR
jgi:hypothetical protein